MRTSIGDFRRESSGSTSVDSDVEFKGAEDGVEGEEEGEDLGADFEFSVLFVVVVDNPRMIEAALTKSDSFDAEFRSTESYEGVRVVNLSAGRATQYRWTRRIASVVVLMRSEMSDWPSSDSDDDEISDSNRE